MWIGSNYQEMDVISTYVVPNEGGEPLFRGGLSKQSTQVLCFVYVQHCVWVFQCGCPETWLM